MNDLDTPSSRLAGQAGTLHERQAVRLVAESEMRFREPSRMPGWGRLLVTQAINESRSRVGEQREDAVARARQAIGRGTAGYEFEVLLDDGQKAIDRAALTWPPPTDHTRRTSQVLFEWAALACVGAAAITDVDFSTLYGPWWRAVVRDIRPVWVTQWSTTSLAGCWVTVAGVVLAPFVNRGDAGYATLGIIVTGSIVWGVGAMLSTARSRPWPEPRRPAGLVAARAWPAQLRRLWRAPETIVWKIVGSSQRR